jgi:hypothetical protein
MMLMLMLMLLPVLLGSVATETIVLGFLLALWAQHIFM